MLKARILSTLKYFNLQGMPLTLLDLHKFLLNDPEVIRAFLDENWEIKSDFPKDASLNKASLGETLKCLENECQEEVFSLNGFYTLKNKPEVAEIWTENYLFGLKREQLINKYLYGLRHLPFIRGVGVLGSQAFGLYKKDSDIDLLILTHEKYMWLTRFLTAAYFQIFFKRRHGNKIANRFCLNHFVVEHKVLDKDLNLYTASEYLKIRPQVLVSGIMDFQEKNKTWINFIFPNIELPIKFPLDNYSLVQKILEKWLYGGFGQWLEKLAKKLQYKRINTGEFIMATDNELSFHPNNRKKELFKSFFES